MTELQELRLTLGVTFVMLIFGMILFWPADDIPAPVTDCTPEPAVIIEEPLILR